MGEQSLAPGEGSVNVLIIINTCINSHQWTHSEKHVSIKLPSFIQ